MFNTDVAKRSNSDASMLCIAAIAIGADTLPNVGFASDSLFVLVFTAGQQEK